MLRLLDLLQTGELRTWRELSLECLRWKWHKRRWTILRIHVSIPKESKASRWIQEFGPYLFVADAGQEKLVIVVDGGHRTGSVDIVSP